MGLKAETFSLTLPEPWAGWVKGLAALFGSESAVLQMCVIFTRGTMPRDIGQLQALVAQIRQGAQEEEFQPSVKPAEAGRRPVGARADLGASPRKVLPEPVSPRRAPGRLAREAVAVGTAQLSVASLLSFPAQALNTRRPAWGF